MALLLSACGTSIPKVKPYKMEIQQGNVVTSKMLLQLKPGMTKSQVRYIMGTPLIQDSFHGNRWDYFYQMREGGKVTEQRLVYLTFKNALLDKVSGDVVPQGTAGAVQSGDATLTGTRTVQPQVKKKEKGFFDRLKFWGDEDELEEIELPKPSEKPIDLSEEQIEQEEDKKGFFSRLKFWGDDEDATAAPKPDAEASVKSLNGTEIVEQPEAK